MVGITTWTLVMPWGVQMTYMDVQPAMACPSPGHQETDAIFLYHCREVKRSPPAYQAQVVSRRKVTVF